MCACVNMPKYITSQVSQHICIVMQEFIHKVRTIGGGRSGSAQSVLARMGGGGEVQLELHVYYNSFAGTLQNKI